MAKGIHEAYLENMRYGLIPEREDTKLIRVLAGPLGYYGRAYGKAMTNVCSTKEEALDKLNDFLSLLNDAKNSSGNDRVRMAAEFTAFAHGWRMINDN